MPLYEYRCENCGEQFEVIQKFVDQPLTIHEKCGGKVNRLISRSALQFKGSGWYVNDYAKGSSSSSNSSNNSSKESKEGGGDNGKSKKSDSKSDSKSDGSSTPAAPAATPSSSSDKK